ncbi:hypothetical protein OC926_22870, partial [Pseudomonas peradeniyensis]|uniref:hypothetical protein n=1 Tax=Pseudomonas peradeniyensis TaxID=2745488 RepID=UPI0021D494D3
TTMTILFRPQGAFGWFSYTTSWDTISPIPSPFTVASLPIGAAGIGDDRQLFANHLAAELARSPMGRASSVQAWIHWPEQAVAGPTSEVSLRGVSVLVIPGIFGDCVADQSLPFSDGTTRTPVRNLTEGYTYLASLGLRRVRAVAVGGRVSSMTNGMTIADAIRQEAMDPAVLRIVVVGYSKGAADTLEALAQLGNRGLPRKPLSFVSLSGVVMGTPLADTHDDLYKKLASRFNGLQCTPSDGHEVTSLTRRERVRWLANHPRLPEVNSYTVLAYTAAEDVSPGLRPFYERLARVDPRNDGQMLAAEAVLPGSTLLAEVKSDHWTYVLPLRDHPNVLVRGAAANRSFPRAAFFRALLRTVVELDEARQRRNDLAVSQRKL